MSKLPPIVPFLCHDITARKAAEAALLDGERGDRLLVEQAADGIFVIGRDGRFVEVNARACAMLGHERGELLGLTSRAVIAPEDLAARPMADPAGAATPLDERLMRRKDGTVFPGEASAARLPDG
jgi:PAS domain S-box-containing protein